MQVLDHQYELPAKTVRRVKHCGTGVVAERLLSPAFDQGCVGPAQLQRELGMSGGALPGEVEQRLKPEVGHVEDLVILFHEPDGEELAREFLVRTKFRCCAGQQHGFAPAAGPNDQTVLTRLRPDVSAQDLEHGREFATPNGELLEDFLVSAEGARIELAELAADPLVGRVGLGH